MNCKRRRKQDQKQRRRMAVKSHVDKIDRRVEETPASHHPETPHRGYMQGQECDGGRRMGEKVQEHHGHPGPSVSGRPYISLHFCHLFILPPIWKLWRCDLHDFPCLIHCSGPLSKLICVTARKPVKSINKSSLGWNPPACCLLPRCLCSYVRVPSVLWCFEIILS